MQAYVIKNRVPSPEELGRALGMTPKRIASIRAIMSSRPSTKSSARSSGRSRAAASKNGTSAKRSNSRRSGRR